MKRVEWSNVTRFLSGPPPAEYTHEDALIAVFSVFLLNPKVLARIARPARGPRAKDQRLYDILPGALFACRELVLKAREDTKLQQQILEVIQEDPVADAYVRCYAGESAVARGQKATAIALAERALRGVVTNTDLLKASPEEVLKDWFYPREKSAKARYLLSLVRQHPPDFNLVWGTWTRLYLGQPGDAAKAFHLIAD